LEKFLQAISFPLKRVITHFLLIISEFKKSNNKFFYFIDFAQKKKNFLNQYENEYFEKLLLLSTSNLIESFTDKKLLLWSKKKHFSFLPLFDIQLLNNIILDLETVENQNSGNTFDFYQITFNNNFLCDSMLFNYSLFQNRIITNENMLFDNFFNRLIDKELLDRELSLYEYFILNYSNFFLISNYNTQIIHSRDNMSIRNFFSIYYYDYFKIQQTLQLLFNPINILDDFRGFSTIIQLNNNILTQNIENYILNLQKLTFTEIIFFLIQNYNI